MKTLIQQEMITRGILFNGVHLLCGAHTEQDVQKTLSAYSEALDILKEAIEAGDIKRFLKGQVISKVFRQH